MSETDVKHIIGRLRGREPLQGLAPKRVWDGSLTEAITSLSIGDGDDASALRSVLLLWNDDLDRSHTLSQGIHTSTGSLIHGMMHRMEGDYGNSEYWFRRAGPHACYVDIAAGAGEIDAAAAFVAGGVWDPYAFTRAVERALQRADPDEIARLKRLQRAEMEAVASYCYQQCFGGTLLE